MATLTDVRAAAERIRPYIVRTPLERSAALSEMAGTQVWLKLECFQLTGSFKLRGALNALQLLGNAHPEQVVAASAGNHGLGVARAAGLLGFSATIVVPETASATKVEALRASGAELVQHGQTYDDAEAEGMRLAKARGARFVSPYNDPGVVAGGGTVALEIVEDLPEVRTVLVPAGGGGLIGGIGVATRALRPDARVIGIQSEASPALHAALEASRVVPVEVKPSLADGLAGNIEPTSITFGLVQDHVSEILLVTEDQIAEAMRWLLLNERVVVEGSGAVGVAALLTRRVRSDGPIAVVLTGRNVDRSVVNGLFGSRQ
jgi:threonine dehydratase